MASPSSKKRPRSDSSEPGDSVDPKRILLDILDDSDVNTVSHELDSFIQTFQNEITPAPEVTETTSDSTDRQELGFLFEASDDELGLPPTESNNTRALAESVELSELWGLDDQFLNYGSFEYEFVGQDDADVNSYSIGEYVALDGLFDHTDVGFGSSDLSWRPETLPAQ